jgi:hypothetical protein
MELPGEQIIKALPVKEVYDDGFQPAVREAGKAFREVLAAGRFILAPIEYIAAWRPRWERYLKRVSEIVPEEKLIQANPEIVGPVILNLPFAEEQGLRAEAFVQLLARSVDKDRASEAHPAYAQIIGQLHPDEALILYLLKKQAYHLTEQSNLVAGTTNFKRPEQVSCDFPASKLAFPQNFRLYMDHLYHLSLGSVGRYGNQDIVKDADNKQIAVRNNYCIRLLSFGERFANACIPDHFEFDKSGTSASE